MAAGRAMRLGAAVGAQYFSAARSSVARRLSPRSGCSCPAPTTRGSSAASRRTDSFACPWSQAQAGWGTLASPSGSGFSRARVDQVDDVADQRHPVALAPEADQARRVAGKVEDAEAGDLVALGDGAGDLHGAAVPAPQQGRVDPAHPGDRQLRRGRSRGRSRRSLSASATSSGWQKTGHAHIRSGAAVVGVGVPEHDPLRGRRAAPPPPAPPCASPWCRRRTGRRRRRPRGSRRSSRRGSRPAAARPRRRPLSNPMRKPSPG